MIYLDSSVALAYLFVEGQLPPEAIWREPLVSSGLLPPTAPYEARPRQKSLRVGLAPRVHDLAH